MYEREQTTTTTAPDGESYHHKSIERTTSGLGEVLFLPIGLTLCGCICWLVIRITMNIDQRIAPPHASPPSAYIVKE